MRLLPFVSSSVAILFLMYALAQAVFLQEPGATLFIVVALVSAALLFLLQWITMRVSLPEHWADRLYAFVAGLILLSMLLRLYVTAELKQTANLILFLVAISFFFISIRWLAGLIALTLLGWMAGSLWPLVTVRQEDWLFYAIVLIAATISAVILHVMRTAVVKRVTILGIRERRQRREIQRRARENARLLKQIRQFNQQLEQKVDERTAELQQANEKLERLDKTKTDFITIASHELRTPLTILDFYSQMFIDDETIRQDESYLKWANGIHQGAMRMEEVVERMLDVAKIDSESLQLYPAAVNLPLLLRSVRDRFQQDLAQRKLTFTIDDLSHLPQVEADAEALQKVFYHLFVNAIKYTPDGGTITVNGRFHSGENGAGHVEIVVADSGIGVDPDVQPLIFEKFYQTGEVTLHSSGRTSFKGGGAGLGLAIAKGIVTAHDGRIWVESSGHDETNYPGSRFHVRLPVQQGPET